VAKRPCARPGCAALVQKGYCAAHAGMGFAARTEAARPSAHKRGYTRRWAEYSRQRLREFPLCADTVREGASAHGLRFVAADVTDHIRPPSGPDDPLFWDATNHQSLCKGCHDYKTATQDGAFGRQAMPRP
jgi:5-methylcytosine-specific restriction protein A